MNKKTNANKVSYVKPFFSRTYKKLKSEALNYTDLILKIENAKTLEELQSIYANTEFGKYKFDKNKYPNFDFTISKEEIRSLEDVNAIGKEGQLLHEYFRDGKKLTTIEKLLYSYIWKRGELNRFPSMISGIKGDDYMRNTGQVLNQFGKYLSNDNFNEPIVDQHVIRAFRVCIEDNESSTSGTVNYRIIQDYRHWLLNLVNKKNLKNKKLAIAIIDKIMFSIGKSLKQQHNR
ncbi:hypothetical protein ACE939_08150 [Aquimarina sp. W85]|uniref:hypothetical protein n=1 Tax=Aquimarina rhodophyticola TaxID=3342246 RepID=UPI00367076C6